ncbi:tail fiber protein [Aeromonas phage Gekk3-15]
MAGILSTFLSKTGCKIYNSDTGSRVFQKLQVVRVQISSPAEVTSSPIQVTEMRAEAVQGGEAQVARDLFQAKVVEPSGIIIEAVALESDQVFEIISAFNDPTITFNVESRGISAKSMSMITAQLSSSEQIISGVKIMLMLEQAIPPESTSIGLAENGADEASYGIGISQPQPVTGLKSAFSDILDKVLQR